MKALFRLPLGKGRYIAVFKDMIVIEYYSISNGEMLNAKKLI